mmetsp:Transcript_1716/g.2650  ORF Transcript_1716/g.2650 Transcript_1716/m.2650 type:complete len:94 (+) Transcript_1716:1431-1712(+)
MSPGGPPSRQQQAGGYHNPPQQQQQQHHQAYPPSRGSQPPIVSRLSISPEQFLWELQQHENDPEQLNRILAHHRVSHEEVEQLIHYVTQNQGR